MLTLKVPSAPSGFSKNTNVKRATTRKLSLWLGVAAGIIYGIAGRLIFGESAGLDSLSFLVGIPTAMGVIALVFSHPLKSKSYLNMVLAPWLSIGGFMLLMFALGIEGVICLLILAAPFAIAVTIIAFIARLVSINKQIRNKTAVIAILAPYLLWTVESRIEPPTMAGTVKTTTLIKAPKQSVWNNIVRVSPFAEEEYNPGLFNWMGIPKPIKAELTSDTLGGLRTGYFEGGLLFRETIKEWQPLQKVSFNIKVVPESIRNVVFDQHVLKGDYFKFVDASYELTQADNGVELTLVSGFELNSHVNSYGRFWADLMLQDFQTRLLQALKKRIETTQPPLQDQ